MDNMRTIIIALTFFLIGSISAFAIDHYVLKPIQAQDASVTASLITPVVSSTPIPTWKEVHTVSPAIYTYPSRKYTITETGRMTADKLSAQTGENVNFTVTIKNEGQEKKFLTHICFNHSGGVTFGCVLNKNLESGESFNINNTMQFTSPGTYAVWLTWSQDHTNFYRPQRSGIASVRVY